MVLVVVIAVLHRMSRQLALSRARALLEQQAHAKRIEHLAYHDALTGLPNRMFFSKLFSQCLQQAKRHARPMAVMFLDIDGFKGINDSLGHDAGDQLLREVAGRLTACVRASDSVARLGGDEFVILLPECGEEQYAATIAEKILAAVALPFVFDGIERCVTTSIGISIFPTGGLDEATLTKNADAAMYLAKVSGKNSFRVHTPETRAILA